MLADSDVGNVVTAAEAGALWGYRLLPLLILLIPLLYMVQALTVRLGVFSGHGHGTLIRTHFGLGWAGLSMAALLLAVLSTLVTELTGIAGIADLCGVSRGLALILAILVLLAATLGGHRRRVEQAALVVGLFELAFFAVAWTSHPDPGELMRQVADIPLNTPGFLYIGAGIIGSVFSPWMVFYQQAAVVGKRIGAADYRSERWDTGIGAILAQALTASILIAVAATLGLYHEGLASVGEISHALTPALGETSGRVIFSIGVLGSALVAAIVASLGLAAGVREIAGWPSRSRRFSGLYAACLILAACLVWLAPDQIGLAIAAQVLNALLLPLLLGFLVTLAARALPPAHRLRGRRLIAVIVLSAILGAAGLIGGLAGAIPF